MVSSQLEADGKTYVRFFTTQWEGLKTELSDTRQHIRELAKVQRNRDS